MTFATNKTTNEDYKLLTDKELDTIEDFNGNTWSIAELITPPMEIKVRDIVGIERYERQRLSLIHI